MLVDTEKEREGGSQMDAKTIGSKYTRESKRSHRETGQEAEEGRGENRVCGSGEEKGVNKEEPPEESSGLLGRGESQSRIERGRQRSGAGGAAKNFTEDICERRTWGRQNQESGDRPLNAGNRKTAKI